MKIVLFVNFYDLIRNDNFVNVVQRKKFLVKLQNAFIVNCVDFIVFFYLLLLDGRLNLTSLNESILLSEIDFNLFT